MSHHTGIGMTQLALAIIIVTLIISISFVLLQSYSSTAKFSSSAITSTSNASTKTVGSVTKTDGVFNFTVKLNTTVATEGHAITVTSYLTNIAGRNVTVDFIVPTLAGLKVVSSDGTVVWGYYPPESNYGRSVANGQTFQSRLEVPTSGLQSGQVYTIETGPGFFYPGTQPGQTGLEVSISFGIR